jgi:hypothetical protein
MRERFPADVYTILVDAAPSRSISPEIASYRGTGYAEPLRRAGVPTGTALEVSSAFDDASRSPIRTAGTTGVTFSLEPRSLRMTDLADAYVFFGN